jgi:hypothetical protein
MNTITYKSTTEEVVNFLKTSIASGIIYNSDYTLIKDILSSRYEKHERELVDMILKASPFVGNSRAWAKGTKELYDALSSNFYTASKFFKLYEKNFNDLEKEIGLETLFFVKYWSAVWVDLYVTAKPLIVKTRKPNPDAKPEDARTLENTGSCPVCGGNFKLEADGTIVRHGYKVEGREYRGSCFGVGFQPFEVSSHGAVKYLVALTIALNTEESSLQDLQETPPETLWCRYGRKQIAQGEVGYNSLLNVKLREKESKIRQLLSDTRFFKAKIKGWTPSTLPGILAGFTR